MHFYFVIFHNSFICCSYSLPQQVVKFWFVVKQRCQCRHLMTGRVGWYVLSALGHYTLKLHNPLCGLTDSCNVCIFPLCWCVCECLNVRVCGLYFELYQLSNVLCHRAVLFKARLLLLASPKYAYIALRINTFLACYAC